MNDKERKVYLETRLRTLKRKYTKMIQHSDLTEDCIDLKNEIGNVECELDKLNS